MIYFRDAGGTHNAYQLTPHTPEQNAMITDSVITIRIRPAELTLRQTPSHWAVEATLNTEYGPAYISIASAIHRADAEAIKAQLEQPGYHHIATVTQQHGGRCE